MKFSSKTIALFNEGEGAKTQSLRGTKFNDVNAESASASTSDGGVTASSDVFPSGTGSLGIPIDDVNIVDAQQNGVVCGQVVHFDAGSAGSAGIGTVPREDALGAVTCALNGGDNFEVEFSTATEAGGTALQLMDLTRDKLKLSFHGKTISGNRHERTQCTVGHDSNCCRLFDVGSSDGSRGWVCLTFSNSKAARRRRNTVVYLNT